MPVTRKTYEDLRSRFRKALERRIAAERDAEQLEADLAAEREEHEKTRRLLDEARAQARSLDGRVQRVTGLLEKTRRDQGAEVARLALRLERLLRACVRYRADLSRVRRPRPTPPAGRELLLSMHRCRQLEARLHDLQTVNDAMSRECVDAAGTLALPAKTGREPGVAP
ncbi:hypothetical protein [Streptomyces sp. NPDC001404]|uniref:hypothetical protein n=1 Tax=Streptomyces sp. NPDC001404 TaxID=3364571 RepID=UPI0036A5FD45